MAHREIRHLTDELDSLRKNEGYCGRGFSDALTVYLKKKKEGKKNANNANLLAKLVILGVRQTKCIYIFVEVKHYKIFSFE